MAMYYSFYDEEGEVSGAWHTGESLEFTAVENANIIQSKTCTVQADGDELAVLKANFINLTFPTKGIVVTWTGDYAKFILLNL